MQDELQVKHEPVFAQIVKEMQQTAIHLRQPDCRLTSPTSNGLGLPTGRHIRYLFGLLDDARDV